MKTLSRWRRRYRTAKRVTGKIKGWFTDDPMSAAHPKKARMNPAGNWDRVKLSGAGRYAAPSWETLENGQRVYGPVRTPDGWIFTDEKGKTVYSKADRLKELGFNVSVEKQKHGQKCGKKRADGKRCQFVGDCPHHRNKLR